MKFIGNIHLKILLLYIWFHKISNLEEKKEFFNNLSWIGEITEKTDDVKKYEITIKDMNSLNNLKVLIKGLNKTLNHYVLSFYQNDSSFTKRYQLFQSYNNEIEMWLNKNQFNDKFYFSIECKYIPCNYSCSIDKINSIELKFNKVYNYYVTNEIKVMEFIFKDNNKSYSNNDKLLIWVKGNKNLTVINKSKNSMGKNVEIKSENICTNEKDINTMNFKIDNNAMENIEKKYQFYLLNMNNYIESKEFNYIISVYGELDDIINVGAIIFNENGTSKFILEDNIEIGGLLKNEGMNKTCFKYIGNKSLTFTNHDHVKINYTEEEKDKFCLTLEDKRDGFFSFYFVNKNNNSKGDLYFPKVIGVEQPMRYIKENNSIQLIISKPSDYFDYFIYNFNTPNNISIEGYFCDSYPFCDESDSMKKIKLYESFKDVTFLKNHFNNHSLSLIDKNQLILIISCINAYIKQEDEIQENIGYNIPHYCLTDINIYKEIYYSQYVFSGNTTTENYTFIHDYSFSYSFLNIELFYGEILIEIEEPSSDQYISFYHKNRYIYEIQNSTCKLKIKANINSYYHINYTPLIMIIANSSTYFTYLYNVEGTYLIHFNEYDNLFSDMFFENNLTNLTNSLLPFTNDSNEDFLLINFNPINCKIEVDSSQSNIINLNNSYQSLNILDYNNSIQSFQYSIKKKNKEEKDCLFLVSVYNLNSNDGSIILSKNVPRIFHFPSNLSYMRFSYYHQRRNLKYIIISLEPYNGTFDVEFLFNNVSTNDTNPYVEPNLASRTEIKVETNNIINDLESENCFERYLIKFKVISHNGNKEAFLKINVLSGNDDLYYFMIIYNSVILFIFICLVLVFLFILFRKRKPKFKKEKSYLIELGKGKKEGEGEVRGNKNEALLPWPTITTSL